MILLLTKLKNSEKSGEKLLIKLNNEGDYILINYILDTDHLSLIQRNNQEGKNILKKLMTLEHPQIAVTIITYEEQVRGRLLFITKAKTIEQQLLGYQGLQKLLTNYQSLFY